MNVCEIKLAHYKSSNKIAKIDNKDDKIGNKIIKFFRLFSDEKR